MARKTSPNNIENLGQDWGNDTNVNLPFSGEAVQTFIKSYLRNVTAAAWFDPVSYTMYFFASEEDRDSYVIDPTSVEPTFSCPMSFSSTLYRINITSSPENKSINVATNAETLTLSATFMVQSKSISDENWTDLQSGCYVTILIDRGLTGIYVPITERALYAAGSTISIDIFDYLANGVNRVKFQFEEEDGKVTQALVYSINLAELYVELWQNVWYQAILENDTATQRLGGFKIAGAGYKVLHFNLYDSEGTKVVNDIQVNIGTTNTYVNTPYYYQFPIDCPILGLDTGVYTVEVYVDTPTMTSEVISYQIMYVETEDVNTAQLVCINSVADRIYNYAEGTLCNYSVYNGGSSFADLDVTFKRLQGETVIDSDTEPLDDVATGVSQDLTYAVIWPDITGDGYSIDFTIEIGSAEASGRVPIDNSTVFPPAPNYDFYMLASTRNNGEAAREKIINEVDGSELNAIWSYVDFANGIDGWTTDNNGRKCLRIPAGARLTLPSSSFNLLSGDNQTFEICYKAVNVADYDENIITLSPNPTAAGFQGIRIRPTNITAHSAQDLNANNDAKQGTNICDDETVHFVLTVNPYFEGSHKLVTGYVNGCKNFLFEYTSASAWSGFNGALSIGSDKTDIFVYFIRHYATALSMGGVQTNYVSSLQTPQERSEMDTKFASVLDSGGTGIDFEAVKNNNYNYFIVKMVQGDGVPSAANGWGKKTEGTSVLEMHYGMHPEWDWRIGSTEVAVETMGQGTTSMNYYRWNIRWRIDKSNSSPANPDDKKKVPIQYVTARTRVGESYQYTWGDASLSKTLRFDGTIHPPMMRITAKINQASSMQSHKQGATRAYTELHDRINLLNEAQSAVATGDPMPVVAVYEYPAFGFEYDSYNNIYNFIGLFTIGPDKGDKPTFGYDTTKSTLISLEGTDHSQPLARFAYPNLGGTGKGSVNYFYGQEGMAINLGEGSYLTGLEMSNCHNKEIDKDNKDNKAAEDEPIIRGILDTEFWPAYELAWKNSTLIFPVTPSTYGQSSVAGTLAYINAHLSGETVADNFRLTPYNSRLTYADMQFWIVGDNTYTLYYYDEAFGEYKPDISLSEQNGTPSGATADDKNEWFKARRRERFMASAGNYWHLDECIYHFVFCLIFGATDNFAKNSYPYKMATLQSGGRWRWRQDDLDTIFDIDNSGRDSKPYFIEYDDANNGTAYFAGSNSVFWNLINECYWDDYNGGVGKGIRSIGQQVINAMVSLSGANNPYDGFVNYISQCFWGNAQEYFPQSAYNVDSYFKYELAWINNGQEVPPLEQALGNHYSGERLWVKRRAIYMLSLFRYGPFGDYSDRNLGRMSFRPVAFSLELVPFLWMYPAAQVGQNTVVTGGRTQAMASCPLSASVDSSGNTPAYIQATNYLASLGNLKDLRLGSNDASVLEVSAAKLITFLIGSANETVNTNIPGLKFQNTACLELIDARNASSIESIEGIGICTRLRTLLLDGTSVSDVDIPVGSKIGTLSLPSGIRTLTLVGLKHLSTFSMGGYSALQTIRIEDTDIDVFAIVQNAYEDSSILEFIRVIWRGNIIPAAGVTEMLHDLGTDPQYKGLAADGSTVLSKPYIEGTIDMSTLGMYTGDFESLDVVSEEDYQTTLKKALSGLFGTPFYIIYDPNNVWIAFADSAVEAICITNWDTSGDGKLSVPEAAAVTNLGAYFRGTAITSFDELQYFIGLTGIPGNAFNGCTALTSVTLPSSGLTEIGSSAFSSCTSLTGSFVIPSSVTTIGSYILQKTGITSLTVPASITSYQGVLCYELRALEELRLYARLGPGNNNFYSATSLVRLYVIDFEQSQTIIPNQLNFANNTVYFHNNNDTHYVYFNDVEVRDLVIPNTMTRIKAGACYRWNRLTSVTIPNTVTEIGDRAFDGCTGLTGTLTIPSSVTSIGANAFNGCTQITSLIINTSSVAPNVFNGVGSSTNYCDVTINGSITGVGTGVTTYIGRLTVSGNVSTSLGNYWNVKQIRIGGNLTWAGGGNGFVYPPSATVFLEIMGNVTCTNKIINSIKTVHLGYNGVITALPGLFNLASDGMFYVGDGSSASHDDAILAQYIANSNWSAYSSRLDTWYNYNGEYKD